MITSPLSENVVGAAYRRRLLNHYKDTLWSRKNYSIMIEYPRVSGFQVKFFRLENDNFTFNFLHSRNSNVILYAFFLTQVCVKSLQFE
jgi:hypothetical protein